MRLTDEQAQRIGKRTNGGVLRYKWLVKDINDLLADREALLIEMHEKIAMRDAMIKRLRAVVAEFRSILVGSRGVDGWHMSGALAEWIEFDQMNAALDALQPGDMGEPTNE